MALTAVTLFRLEAIHSLAVQRRVVHFWWPFFKLRRHGSLDDGKTASPNWRNLLLLVSLLVFGWFIRSVKNNIVKIKGMFLATVDFLWTKFVSRGLNQRPFPWSLHLPITSHLIFVFKPQSDERWPRRAAYTTTVVKCCGTCTVSPAVRSTCGLLSSATVSVAAGNERNSLQPSRGGEVTSRFWRDAIDEAQSIDDPSTFSEKT